MTDNTIGPHRPDDHRGWLVFEHLPDELQRAEDATQAADFAAASSFSMKWSRTVDPDTGRVVRYFTRPATAAERTLLAHLGYTLPEALDCSVSYVTETLRRRRWPALESQTPQGGNTP
ncbi:hypothetical protein [Mycobacterium sp. PSTR-4-N]|uniref:hypothetical protein n=1 Tax=Mycobacterium sp. PSTR-4-N TaxID=2917745 RepID=UPI001F151B49|nr:hypothetical protein [Mycobacterium sp. PSTR-4-N]MCG7597836.1 hypothetical protein [Mycobacterium sp. PSTR-4-N]